MGQSSASKGTETTVTAETKDTRNGYLSLQEAEVAETDKVEYQVYVNANSEQKQYHHRLHCPEAIVVMTLAEAKARGRHACRHCESNPLTYVSSTLVQFFTNCVLVCF